jgi:hypothetical protein
MRRGLEFDPLRAPRRAELAVESVRTILATGTRSAHERQAAFPVRWVEHGFALPETIFQNLFYMALAS